MQILKKMAASKVNAHHCLCIPHEKNFQAMYKLHMPNSRINAD